MILVLCILFFACGFMHIFLCVLISASYSLHIIHCILFFSAHSIHSIVCVSLHASYYLNLVLCLLFYGFHSIHLLECISFYTSRSMHLIICISFYASQVYIYFILYITFYAFSSVWYILTIFETSSHTDMWTWRPIAKPGHNCKLVYGPLVCLMLAINHLGKRRRTVTACAMLKRMATQHQCNFTDK